MIEGKISGSTAWEDGEMLCRAEKEDEFVDPADCAGVQRIEPGEKDVGVL